MKKNRIIDKVLKLKKNKNKSDIDIIMAECPSDYGIKNNKDNEGYKDCRSCIKCWNRPYSK